MKSFIEGVRSLWQEHVTCPTTERALPPLPPPQLYDDLFEAVKTERWMVAVFRIDETGLLHMDRHTTNFPGAQHAAAIELLTDDLARLKATCTCPIDHAEPIAACS